MKITCLKTLPQLPGANELKLSATRVHVCPGLNVSSDEDGWGDWRQHVSPMFKEIKTNICAWNNDIGFRETWLEVALLLVTVMLVKRETSCCRAAALIYYLNKVSEDNIVPRTFGLLPPTQAPADTTLSSSQTIKTPKEKQICCILPKTKFLNVKKNALNFFPGREIWCIRSGPCHGLTQTWWRHQIEIFSPLLTLCEGNPPVTDGLHKTRGLSAYKACSRFSSVIILVKIYT